MALAPGTRLGPYEIAAPIGAGGMGEVYRAHDTTLNRDIASAHIATFGEKAVDVFYVTDLTGKKITSASREGAIRERLVKALQARQEPALLTA